MCGAQGEPRRQTRLIACPQQNQVMTELPLVSLPPVSLLVLPWTPTTERLTGTSLNTAPQAIWPTPFHSQVTSPSSASMSIASTQLNNHRNAVAVQDLATQLIQSYPCITKKTQETEKEFAKVSRAVRSPKGH